MPVPDILLKAGKSLIWLTRMVVMTIAHAIGFLVRGDLRASAEQLRFLGIVVHDDLLAIVVFLQRLRRRAAPPLPHLDRILIVKLDRIGDMVNTTPVLDELARAFPAARIDLVGHPVPLSFFDGDPRVHECIPYRSALYHAVSFLPPSWREWKTIATLFRRRYPLVVYLRGSAPFLCLAAVSPFAATKYLRDEHVVERYLKAIRPFVPDARLRTPKLYVPPKATQAIEARIGTNVDTRRIAIHATAAVPLKEWPLERYVAVADELHRRYQAEIHFLAGPAERDRLETALGRSPWPHAVHTSLGLQEVVALIAGCDLFVGNDSGLSHIAAAVNTPMVLVWGPANINEAKPLVDPARCAIVYRSLPCRSICPEIRCVNESPMQCLRDLQVHQVLASVSELLGPARKRMRLRVGAAS